MKRLKFIACTLILSTISFGFGKEETAINKEENIMPPFYNCDTNWVETTLKTLTIEEKIAQLFMVAAYSNKGDEHKEEITKLITEYKIGGLIFFQGGPVRQAIQTNYYQSISKVPLMLSIDGEWGLSMRLDSTISFPRQMMLGAIQNDALIYEMGAEIARQCKRIGLHVNLAPVVDVNNNPKNPVINSRSFGEDKYNVARKGIAYMKGMQDAGVMANAKHFPGHGDTDSDSHLSLPIIKHNKARLDSLELYPFREMIKAGLGSMMVAHLNIPALDDTKNLASTLSPKIVNGMLKGDLNFKGLVFTDALNMKGVSAYYKPGIVDVKALLAGNDVLLFSEDVPTAIDKIKEAITNGEISVTEIEDRCRKILLAKSWLGLSNLKPVDVKNIYTDLNTKSAQLINRKLIENAITVVKNDKNILPVQNLDQKRIASVVFGTANNSFQTYLNRYAKIDDYVVTKYDSELANKKLIERLKAEYDLIIIGVTNTNSSASKSFGVTYQTVNMIADLAREKDVIVDVFASPYSLSKLKDVINIEGLIMSYQDTDLTQEISAQIIFGAIDASGKLPVSTDDFKVNTGVNLKKINRLNYAEPEKQGIKSGLLAPIDSIIEKAIKAKVMPGCQVLVAKGGTVIYNKAFGYHTYNKEQPVLLTDVYDLASVTKILGTMPLVIKLQKEGLLKVDNKLKKYLPKEYRNSNKGDIIIREMLAHQAGLAPWIPFYLETIKNERRAEFYSYDQTAIFPNKVAHNLFMKDYKRELLDSLFASELLPTKKYKYSDLGYYILWSIIENITDVKFDELVSKSFYSPMGLSTMGYKPMERINLNRIVPTEDDKFFRNQLVWGTVHDQGAAIMGGVCGHAGLFSNSNDVAIMLQMLLQDGNYGNVQYLDKKLINEFTACQYCDEGNRRGVGFDRPTTGSVRGSGPTCGCTSGKSFGHSGFTGTMVWVDPEYDLTYVFLSNRVYPDAENKRLITMGIRTKIQQVIYDAINGTPYNDVPETQNSFE